MDMFILLIVLQLLSLNDAYNTLCPSQAHWKLRAKSMCKPAINYTCLYDLTLQVNAYRDRCSRPRILDSGYKYVFQPNLNRAACSLTRYQPFIFDTIGSSDCTFLKSACNSEGQTTYGNGNSTSDRECMCNTYQGYGFVQNTKNQSYCNPSNEDCSCYIGFHSNNKTICSKDLKCLGDINITQSRSSGDVLTKLQRFKNSDFDNVKYNLYCHSNGYSTKAFVCVLITILSYSLAVAIYILHRTIRQWQNKVQIHHPTSLDVSNMIEHIATIKNGTEMRTYVRIQVIGKDGVGKSSLVRRLVGDLNTNINSTDGIDIVKKCQIRTTDGEWVIGKAETERQKIIKRIQEAVYKEQTQSQLVSREVNQYEGDTNGKEAISSEEPLSEVERKQENQHETKNKIRIASLGSNAIDKNKTNDLDNISTASIDKSLIGKNKVNIQDTVTLVAEKSNIDKHNKNNGVLSKDGQKSVDSVKTGDMRNKITEQMNEILVEVKKDQDRMASENLVECGLWDFAGQKDYYATHQTFLNPHAIYLLVANISEDIAATEDGTNFDSIEEYIDFWFDSIHCLRTSSPENSLDPPVIVVCTHIDEYKTEKEVEDRKKEYIERFKETFGCQNKANHNRGIYFISNKEYLKSDFKKLKDKISDVAKKMMFFAEELPMQWIQLENALSVLKHDSKQNILSWQTIVELAQMLFIKEKELLPFLTYQHKIGNIIFFEDIKEYIILQPDWLVKCFRCLVCDNHPHKRNIEIVQLTDWHNLEKTGQLSDNIIDRLFEKEPDLEFGKYKTHILKVMEKFDIIVKPQLTANKNDSSLIQNSYYMPCMITTQSNSLNIIQKSFESERSSFSSSPWLILEFKFLPLAYFNHILFYYITRYSVCEEKEGRKTIYRGKALVNLDTTGLRKLCICFSKNVIALQVWKLTEVEYSRYDTIIEELCRKIEELKRKLSQNISYDIKAKCRKGDYSNTQGRITLKKLGEICEQGHYFCSEHKEMHSKDDVENTWLQHADIVMERLNEEQDEKKNSTNSIENFSTSEDLVQTPVRVNIPVSLTLLKKINIKTSTNENQFNFSCIKIDNVLMFTDCYNTRLISCNSEGTATRQIPLPYRPFYITILEVNFVAVSCREDRSILIINLSTSDTSRINTSGKCYGISYKDYKLYVVIDRNIIQVIDLTGRVKRTIPLPSDTIEGITVDKDRFVCIDYTSIYCYSLEGILMWTFNNHKFNDLRGVTTDYEGNTYVTDIGTHTVVVVYDEGKYHEEILTKSDGLDKPRGIYFYKKEKILLVSNYRDGKVFLFYVKKKLT